MATIISLVILILAALTLWKTFQSAGVINANPNADVVRAAEVAYNRQKDVMLYALALFGTVTGYYLGRVPAEVNAKRAEQQAESAQKQLAKTQDKLTDTAASASVASAQLGQAKEENAKIASSLKESKDVLKDVRQTLSGPIMESRRATLGASGDEEQEFASKLEQARERIDRVLARIDAG